MNKRRIVSLLMFLFVWILFPKGASAKVYVSGGHVINGAYAKGIDVSHNNGLIDWNKVKRAGIEFAIIRCGYGTNRYANDDKQWENNITACEKLGIPYGVYLYSGASTTLAANSEANHVLRLLKGHKPQLGVYYDMESDEVLAKTTAKQRAQIARAFCNRVKRAGYSVGIYSNLYWFEHYLTEKEFDQWPRWIAQYSSKCTYKRCYVMWQAKQDAVVPGISEKVCIDYRISPLIYQKPSFNVKAIGKKKVKVTWSYKKSGTTCSVYYSTQKGKNFKRLDMKATKGFCKIKKLKKNKKYYFKIQMTEYQNGVKIASLYSKVKKVKIR